MAYAGELCFYLGYTVDENAKYEVINRHLLSTTMRAVRCGLLVGPTVETVGILLICGFLVWCFFAHVTLANILPMVAPLLLIYKPIKQMCNLQVSIETAHASLQRVWSLLDLDTSLPENPEAKPKDSFTDRVVFDDVTFRYDTAEADAVSHASFEIPRGKMVAVVGGTGSGKTTMSGLLARFFDPQSGKVTMGVSESFLLTSRILKVLQLPTWLNSQAKARSS